MAPPAAPQKSFGEEQLDPKRRASQPDEADLTLHARITELRKIGASAFAVTLDNGQVWRHEDAHLGSYLREGRAAVEQDRLYEKGYKLVMKKTTAPVPVARLTAGRYASKDEAGKDIARLKKQGIAAHVVKAGK